MGKKNGIEYAKERYENYYICRAFLFGADIIVVIGFLVILIKYKGSNILMPLLYLFLFTFASLILLTVVYSKRCKKIEKDIKEMEKENE